MKKERKEYHSDSSGIFFAVESQLYCQNSAYQKIEVIKNPRFGHVLLLDGLVQTTEKDEFFYHEMLVHPALVAHPHPQNILIVGGGDGGALKEVLRYPVKQVRLVEIDERVIAVSKTYFPWLRRCQEDERVKIVIAEGKEFLRRSDIKYDVVLVDSSDPVGPSAALHEKDFYEALKNSLHAEGAACIQAGSPYYHSDVISQKKDLLRSFFSTVCFYLAPVPTYPGGLWCFAFLSESLDPFSVRRNPPPGLKYFNLDIHRAAYALPNFLEQVLRK
jgi:spermidine synthase